MYIVACKTGCVLDWCDGLAGRLCSAVCVFERNVDFWKVSVTCNELTAPRQLAWMTCAALHQQRKQLIVIFVIVPRYLRTVAEGQYGVVFL